MRQFAEMQQRKLQIDAEQPPMVAEVDALKAQIKEFDDKMSAVKVRLSSKLGTALRNNAVPFRRRSSRP